MQHLPTRPPVASPGGRRATVTPVSSLDDLLSRARAALATVIHGNDDVLEHALVALAAGGHLLLEDVPGVGKTTLARAIGRSFQMDCHRVQFTPDLLPTDILGTQVLDPRDGSLRFQRGPVFTQVLLADEINRASPRTQSALLEAMNEGGVTMDGVTHGLPRPFFVLATQNPVDHQGTYPLPEAQLDRFMLRLSVGYPDAASEWAMLTVRRLRDPVDDLTPIADAADLLALQARVREVAVHEEVGRYLLRLVPATRDHKDLALGVSPRGSIALYRASQALAFLRGRAFVSPDDVRRLAVPVLAHRVQCGAEAAYAGVSTRAVIAGIVESVPVPT